MPRPLRRYALTIAVLAAAAQLLTPAGASASTRQAKFDIPPNAIGTGTVKCPTGERATGGGYVASNSGYSVDVGASRKIGQAKWRTTVKSYSGVPDTGTVFVYCSSNAPETTQTVKTKGLGEYDVGYEVIIEASCAGLGAVQAGGFSTPPGKGFVVTSRRLGSAWRIRAQHVFGDIRSATSYAYCAKSGAPVVREGAPVAGTGTEPKTAKSAPCAGGAAPLAGGFRQPDTSQPQGNGFEAPNVLRRANGRWRATASHRENFGSLVAIAYCP